MHQAKVTTIAVDDAGLVVDDLFKPGARNAKLVYVTPSHQFPTGAIMPLPRRLALLSWAHKNGAIILEDDYDSEYRYSGKSIPALQGLDGGHSVIYTSSFTKVMFPALSIGYMVIPEHLVDVYSRTRALCCDQPPLPLQDALATFIEEGLLERHMKRMRALYNERRKALIASLAKHFDAQVTISGDNAGLHLLAQFHLKLSSSEIHRRATAAGVGIISTAQHYAAKPAPAEFIFGYGGLTEKQIEDGIKRLSKALR